jgi:hypothetical protein
MDPFLHYPEFQLPSFVQHPASSIGGDGQMGASLGKKHLMNDYFSHSANAEWPSWCAFSCIFLIC